MSEHEPLSQESNSAEQSAELEQIAAEARAEHEASAEHQTEKESSPEEQAEKVETAREKVEQQTEEQPSFEEKTPEPPKHAPTRVDRQAAYRETMAGLQRKLDPASRAFSRLIHQPAVEKTSEVVGKTVLRPSVTLGATVTALLVVGSLYYTASHYGFTLHGSELPLALVLGGIAGAFIELVLRIIVGITRKQR